MRISKKNFLAKPQPVGKQEEHFIKKCKLFPVFGLTGSFILALLVDSTYSLRYELIAYHVSQFECKFAVVFTSRLFITKSFLTGFSINVPSVA